VDKSSSEQYSYEWYHGLFLIVRKNWIYTHSTTGSEGWLAGWLAGWPADEILLNLNLNKMLNKIHTK